MMIERLRAVSQSGVERDRVLLEDGLQVLGAVDERGVELQELVVEVCLQLLGAAAERARESGRVGLEHDLELLGAPANGRLQAADARRQRALERGEVLACAVDDLGELHLLIGELVDQHRDLAAQPLQGFGDGVARVDERVALAGELLDQAADLALVILVGALQQRDLVVDHRLELAGTAERARDGIVHERDLAAHRLAERGRRLLCEPVGFGEADRHLGHRRGAQAKLLRAPCEQSQQPQHADRQHDGRDGEERRWPGHEVDETQHRRIGAQRHDAEGDAYGRPDDADGSSKLERGVRGLLLQRVDEAADAGAVIVGGDAVAGGAGRAAAGDAAPRRPGRLGIGRDCELI